MLKKTLLVLTLIIGLVVASLGPALAKKCNPPTEAKVVRDQYGRPRIEAPTNDMLFSGFGYVTAGDRLWQLEYEKRNGRGTLAEILGPSFLAADKSRRLYGYTEEEYQQMFNSLRHETQQIIQAYVVGINAAIDELIANPGRLPYEFKKLGITPSRWTPTDVLAKMSALWRRFGINGGTELTKLGILQKLIARHGAETGWKMFDDLYWVNDPDSPTYIKHETAIKHKHSLRTFPNAETALRYVKHFPDVDKAAKQHEQMLAELDALGEPLFVDHCSFGWAVTKERSATGYPLFSGDPQPGYAYPGVVYESHLRGGQGFDVAGYNFPGLPFFTMGRNKDVAWTYKVGMGDNVDIYAETLNPNNHEQYLYDGKWVNMEKRVETFNVAGGSPVTMTIYRTVHGPVMSPNPFDPSDLTVTQVYTWKYAHWMIEPTTLDGMMTINRARNMTQFEKGVRGLFTSMHVVYADRMGNIAYWQSGLVPMRPADSDFRLPLLGTGEQEWTGAFRSTPKAVNPARGFISGWNSKASPEFDNPDNSMYGKYHRAWWLERALRKLPRVTPQDMENINLMMGSISMEEGIFVEDLLPYLKKAIEAVSASDPYYQSLNNALALLSDWDGLALDNPVSGTTYKVAHTIFDTFLPLWIKNVFDDEFKGITSGDFNMLLHALDGPSSPVRVSRNYFDDITTPGIVETVDDMIVKSMRQTIDALTAKFQTSDMSKWITPRRTTNIVHQYIGTIGSFPFQNSGVYSTLYEMKPQGIVGVSRWPYGASAFIGMDASGKPDYSNPHLFDMQELYENFEYKPIFIEEKRK